MQHILKARLPQISQHTNHCRNETLFSLEIASSLFLFSNTTGHLSLLIHCFHSLENTFIKDHLQPSMNMREKVTLTYSELVLHRERLKKATKFLYYMREFFGERSAYCYIALIVQTHCTTNRLNFMYNLIMVVHGSVKFVHCMPLLILIICFWFRLAASLFWRIFMMIEKCPVTVRDYTLKILAATAKFDLLEFDL